jgi:hypothetical protein
MKMATSTKKNASNNNELNDSDSAALEETYT